MENITSSSPESLEIDPGLDDSIETRQMPRPSTFATLLPVSNPTSSKQLSHIYVRNKFNSKKPNSLRPFISHRASPSFSKQQSPTNVFYRVLLFF